MRNHPQFRARHGWCRMEILLSTTLSFSIFTLLPCRLPSNVCAAFGNWNRTANELYSRQSTHNGLQKARSTSVCRLEMAYEIGEVKACASHDALRGKIAGNWLRSHPKLECFVFVLPGVSTLASICFFCCIAFSLRFAFALRYTQTHWSVRASTIVFVVRYCRVYSATLPFRHSFIVGHTHTNTFFSFSFCVFFHIYFVSFSIFRRPSMNVTLCVCVSVRRTRRRPKLVGIVHRQ